MEEDVLLKKLRWRCRRGMRELDQLFGRYLDHEWSTAPTEEREVFLFLLDCEDDKLWRWFMGYEACPHAHAIPHAEDPRPQALSGALAAAGRRPAGGAAGCALLLRASDLPSRLLMPAVVLAWGIGLAELAWRQRSRACRCFCRRRPSRCRWPGRTSMHHGWSCVAHGCCCSGVRIGAAGLLFWPDVLDSGQRRELRLAVAARAVSRRPRRWHHKLN
jgi:antitoxin CptB